MKAETGQDIDKAAYLLSDGEVIAIPTETVYGLAANCFNLKAVANVFKIKKRPNFDPLIVHIAGLQAIDRFAKNIPSNARQLAESFWPGPLTLVLPKQDIIPFDVTSGLDTVALRVPKHSMTLSLLSQLPFPLAAPSANPFGYISPTSAEHVFNQLGNDIPYILDGGPAQIGIESTIVGFENEIPVIYRYGIITPEQIKKVVGNTLIRVHTSSNPQAPGMLHSHYAPRTHLFITDLNTEITNPNVGFLAFSIPHPQIHPTNQVVLSESGNVFEAARNLYAALRKLDNMNFSCIYTSLLEDESGEATAINDRLKRASFQSDTHK